MRSPSHVAPHERCAHGVGKVAQRSGALRVALLRRLVGHPHGVPLPRDQLGERLIQRHAVGRVARDDELRLQPALVVDRQEADDRGAGALPQQVERDFDHAIRIAAAQQLDAQLIQQHQLLDLLGAGQPGERLFVRFLHGDRQVLHDRLHQLRIVALGGRRLFRLVKLELVRADADRVAVDDASLRRSSGR